jgi:hypothetical protein
MNLKFEIKFYSLLYQHVENVYRVGENQILMNYLKKREKKFIYVNFIFIEMNTDKMKK